MSRLVFAPAVADKDSKRRPHGAGCQLAVTPLWITVNEVSGSLVTDVRENLGCRRYLTLAADFSLRPLIGVLSGRDFVRISQTSLSWSSSRCVDCASVHSVTGHGALHVEDYSGIVFSGYFVYGSLSSHQHAACLN